MTKKCFRCTRSSYLNQDLCAEHYLQYHNLAPTFRKKKENEIRDFIIFYVTLIMSPLVPNISWNRKLDKNTNIFPDLKLTFEDSLVLFEIDEYGHKRYNTLIETERYEKLKTYFLTQDQYKRIIMIRINPDAYKKNPPIWTKIKRIIIPGKEEEERIITNLDEWEFRTRIIKLNLEEIIKLKKYQQINNEIIEINLFFD